MWVRVCHYCRVVKRGRRERKTERKKGKVTSAYRLLRVAFVSASLTLAAFSDARARAVDRAGRDAYLANVDRYRMPISFLTGEHNRMFVPRGLQRSYEHVRAANGPERYAHHVFKDYAHLDLWLGEQRRARRLPDRPRRAGAPGLVSTTADGPAPDTAGTRPAALQDLFSYPVMSCLQDRRTRRVAQGVSLKAGDMSYESANEPSPLTPLEEAILIAAHRAHRRGDARRAARQAQRQARARHAVPARHRPRRVAAPTTPRRRRCS